MHKEKAVIRECLNHDLAMISQYLIDSELIINLKKGKQNQCSLLHRRNSAK